MDYTESSLPCQRSDFTTPLLVFGGLLLMASAICSTLDTPVAGPVLADEVIAANAEGVIGPLEIDPYAVDCAAQDSEKSSIVPVHSTSDLLEENKNTSDRCL